MTKEVNYELVSGGTGLQEAFAVRHKVFVAEQGIPASEEYDGHDVEALHVLARRRGRVVGTVRVRFLSGNQAKLERMAVLKSYRRKGVGRGMMSFLEERLRNRQVGEIVLHAQYTAAPFYKSCGYEECGEPFWEVEIKHVEMRRKL